MWTYNNSYEEIYHHGVKGMKWGVRRYQNADGSLTAAGKKRYAQEGFAEDAYNSNKSKLGKAYDKFTGAHKTSGQMKYESATKAQRDARAEKYYKEHVQSNESKRTKKLKSQIEDYDRDIKDWSTGYKDKKGKVIISDKDAKEVQKRLIEDKKKLEVKLIKSQYRDQYNAGKSAVSKALTSFMGTDKTYADTMYDLNERSKVNSKWRD